VGGLIRATASRCDLEGAGERRKTLGGDALVGQSKAEKVKGVEVELNPKEF